MSADIAGVIELTEQNFASSIDGHPFAVVDFWAPSCAPCHAFAKIFAAAAARNPDALFGRVNTEDQRAIGAQFNIRLIPTLMIFRGNIIVHAKAGALQASALDEVLRAARALDMEQVQRKVVSVDGVALGALRRADARYRRAGCSGREPPLNRSLSTPIASRTRVGVDGRYPSYGGRRANRDTRRLRAGLCRADVSQYSPLHGLASVYEGYEEDFQHIVITISTLPEEYPADLAWCSKVFTSSGTKAWATRLSGQVLYWTGPVLRGLVPPGRPFPPSQ